jgi:2,3-bisphosphoglycerate-dependent phosphoglycerate mutase
MANHLVLLRHGQSQWNLESRFTGWHDIDLDDAGRQEAVAAGTRLAQAGMRFDKVFTSTLQRAVHTAEIALAACGQRDLLTAMAKLDDLRERDYGELTSLNKADTARQFGEAQVLAWRRSYAVRPPGGESLQDVVENRVRPCYLGRIRPLLAVRENVLVVAHGNSLRAMLIVLGSETPATIADANIPTGVPLVFTMAADAIGEHHYLSDDVRRNDA